MAKVETALGAELVVEVMVLAGVNNPQDAVEAVVRDCIARGHRTEMRTGEVSGRLREVDGGPRVQEG
ncbi:DUF2191 domain-containing protein [Streptomyces sp. TRM 70361]|uniref:DUF2191 domain-containing protein n=1 Tax=Streptomyces sp. TRM 70361 TaxID=3116553 RepID=UPI002E7C068F|nr:DUF2191 domain-containing protein [Streptomyces sp. TRM 70361]MEE1941016.1 DUF2191 domain-containing protein [Streptomyces sp. TRM 70361]